MGQLFGFLISREAIVYGAELFIDLIVNEVVFTAPAVENVLVECRKQDHVNEKEQAETGGIGA